MPQKQTARDRRGLQLARLIDHEYTTQVCAKRYDARAYEKLLAQQLPKISDHWEQLELRRRCAGRQLALAVDCDRGLAEVTRLFNKQRKLGYSSLDDEFGHLISYGAALLANRRRADAVGLLRDFAERVATLRKECDSVREAVAKALGRF